VTTTRRGWKVAGGWRTDADVTAAREVAVRKDAVVAMVLWVDRATGLVGGASYGLNRKWSDIGGKWLMAAAEAVEDAIAEMKQ